MPHYYFHLTDGKQVLNNHKGIDLAGNAAARDDALALARDLKLGAVMPGWNWTGWFVTGAGWPLVIPLPLPEHVF